MLFCVKPILYADRQLEPSTRNPSMGFFYVRLRQIISSDIAECFDYFR